MKRALVIPGLVLIFLFTAFVSVRATGPPVIGIYFDRALTQQNTDCPDSPPGSVLDTLYLAVSGIDTPIEGIEYQIIFPPQIIFLGDIEPGNGLKLGDSNSGMSIAFFSPLDAANPVIIQEVLILWICQGCEAGDILITIVPHPATGSLRVVTSNLNFEDVYGLTSIVCPWCVGCTPEEVMTASRAMSANREPEQCVLDCPAGDGGVILPGSLPGQHHTVDLNDDGTVDIVDFSHFALAYVPNPYAPESDFYCSGNVDLIDFVLFTRHWWHSEDDIPVMPSTWGSIKVQYLD